MSPSLSYPKPTCKLLINGVHHISLIASKALKMEVSEKGRGALVSRWDGMIPLKGTHGSSVFTQPVTHDRTRLWMTGRCDAFVHGALLWDVGYLFNIARHTDKIIVCPLRTFILTQRHFKTVLL